VLFDLLADRFTDPADKRWCRHQQAKLQIRLKSNKGRYSKGELAMRSQAMMNPGFPFTARLPRASRASCRSSISSWLTGKVYRIFTFRTEVWPERSATLAAALPVELASCAPKFLLLKAPAPASSIRPGRSCRLGSLRQQLLLPRHSLSSGRPFMGSVMLCCTWLRVLRGGRRLCLGPLTCCRTATM
jgi:hypothetical protein